MELGLFTKWYNTNKETATTSQNTRTYSIKKKKTSQAFTRISKSNNKKKISGPSVFVSAQIHRELDWVVCVCGQNEISTIFSLCNTSGTTLLFSESQRFFFSFFQSAQILIWENTQHFLLFFLLLLPFCYSTDGWFRHFFLQFVSFFFFLVNKLPSLNRKFFRPE